MIRETEEELWRMPIAAGTQRDGRQQRTQQAKQQGASAKGGSKASKKEAANRAVRRLGKTEKHTSG